MNKVIILVCMMASITFAQLMGPKISVQQSEFNFGDIKQGNVVAHEFVIHNTGDDALEIKNVRASCGCTAVKPEKDVLKPGESTKIKVTFNTAGREGKQQKYVYITTNDKEKPEVRLKFNATVLADNQTEQSSDKDKKN